jgi:hypothetical protein
MGTVTDPLIDPGGNRGSQPEPTRTRKIKCEFCECELGASGEYMRLSEKAKGLRKAEETIEELNKELGRTRTELEELKRQHQPAPRAANGEVRGLTL